ncbi:Uncharacterized protein HZ326_30101 [Fusarium oxysporum f. sp. albedinis]|nr:Uncharacterized protein HZ326_30101 [Fusarium oxysporum f. sp. albedinis]
MRTTIIDRSQDANAATSVSSLGSQSGQRPMPLRQLAYAPDPWSTGTNSIFRLNSLRIPHSVLARQSGF